MIIQDSLGDIPIIKAYVVDFIKYNQEPNTDENILYKQKLKKAFLNKYIKFERKLKESINAYFEIINKDPNFIKLYRKEILDELLNKINKIHKIIEEELSNISTLTEEDLDFSSIDEIMEIVLYDFLESPEIKYFYRMCTFTIIFEGPDRTGKSTLITFFKRFFMTKHMNFIERNLTKIHHVSNLDKQKIQSFLDLSNQDDRLLFQNNLFDKVNIKINNGMKENWKLNQNTIMDRSLLSNLIYSYTMLDEEHFAKYLFSNFHMFINRKIVSNEQKKNLSSNNNNIDKNIVSFLENKFYNIRERQEKYSPNSLNLNKEDSLELENVLEIENSQNGQYSTNVKHNYQTRHFIYDYKESIEKYTTNILYIKNSIYSYNKLDDIEKNSNQYRIQELFSMFKDKKNLNEFLKMRNYTPDKSIEFKNNIINYNFINLAEILILNSFNSITGNIDIIYDDDIASNVDDIFNNALNKIIELNYKKYLEDKKELIELQEVPQ